MKGAGQQHQKSEGWSPKYRRKAVPPFDVADPRASHRDGALLRALSPRARTTSRPFVGQSGDRLCGRSGRATSNRHSNAGPERTWPMSTRIRSRSARSWPLPGPDVGQCPPEVARVRHKRRRAREVRSKAAVGPGPNTAEIGSINSGHTEPHCGRNRPSTVTWADADPLAAEISRSPAEWT